MWRVRELLGRLLNAVWRGRAERDLAREVEAHLGMLEERFRREGMSPEEARRAARRAFGGVEQAKDVQRDARSLLWLDDTRRDIGYALRTLRRTPGFTTTAIITLGLGIGAATVIYSVVRNVVLDPFPYQHSDRMVDVVIRDASNNVHRGALPIPEFLDYQEQSDVFEEVIGALGQGMYYIGHTGAERVSVVHITPNTFDFLGVAPLIGRSFGVADAAPDAPKVAVLNYRTWTTVFGRDPSMVGRTITLNGEPRTIVGIMPPRFEWHVADFWIPSPISRSMPNAAQTRRWFQARLRRGVSIEEAEAQLAVIARRRAAAFPNDYPEKSRVQVITVIDWVVGRFRQTLYTLFAAVALLLLIACCNVANMLLARSTIRARELTIRAALGASRQRIVRQLLIESALLALGGAGVGIALAYGGIRALAGLMPRAGVAWEVQLRLDEPALWFALGAAMLSTLIFGVLPAFQSARRDLVADINAAGRSGTASPRQKRLRHGLVVAEVALSVILLLGAGLLMRTFTSLMGVDLGFDTRNVLMAGMAFPPGPADNAARRQFYQNMLQRVRALPGVQAAAVGNGVPPVSRGRTNVEIPGMDLPERPTVIVNVCSEDYDRVVGLQLLRGRVISAADVAAGRKVAVINETFASRHFARQEPLGRMIRFPAMTTFNPPVPDPTFEIIGVVKDIVNQSVTDPIAPHAFLAFGAVPLPFAGLVVRTFAEPMALAEPIRQEIREIDRSVAVTQPIALEQELLNVYYARPRFNLLVLGIFAAVGLVLVALGIYGVLAYTVSQETRQIAIRMALGGERRHMMVMVLRNGVLLLLAGLVVGVGAGLLTNRLLESVLWRVAPNDPTTIAATAALVVGIGLCACWVPAWRAMRVDPVVALRQE